jgi:hypothetical protein
MTVVAHVITGGRYGFHRDELATLNDARHLSWGFVAYPPVTPFFGWLSLKLFGTSLTGFRFFAALAMAVGVVLTGLIARELGGSRRGQVLAAFACVPFALAAGALMQYVAFDFLWWVLAAFFVVKLLRTEDPRWCVAVGVAIGLGLMTKYSMAFFAFSIAAGLLFTEGRRYLSSKWFWMGIGVAVLICIPNVIWQWRHDFVSLDFLRHIHERDVRIGRTKDFLPDQLQFLLFALPIALAGLWWCFRSPRFRALGWMYFLPLAIFIVLKGRGYYLIPAYPMLLAAGSVWFSEWLEQWSVPVRTTVWSILGLGLAANTVLFSIISLPMAAPGTHRFEWALKNNGDLAEEIGWPELVAEVARIWNTFVPEERSRVGILAANYGEAGAISLYGPQHGLPEPISGINSYWYQGYPDPPPQMLIVLGFSQRFRDRNFTECRLAGKIENPYNVLNEETREHPDIFICTGLKQSWAEFWKDFHYYG